MEVLIVGAGYMSSEYAKALQDQEVGFQVVGRGDKNVTQFRNNFPGIKCFEGGIDSYFDRYHSPEHVIIATNVEDLFSTSLAVLINGAKKILLEKPGALKLEELKEIKKTAEEKEARIWIAYNRRFHVSTKIARKIIQEDQGVLSCHFEFTEWIHKIDPEMFSKVALEHWILANSSHVIDLAFFFCGRPKEIHPIVSGDKISWHPAGSIFVGSGITERNIPFSYHANWGAPGRWSVELLTAKRRLYFQPMERLKVQDLGSVSINEVEDDYSVDIDYKPGLYKQTMAFLEKSEDQRACRLEEHLANLPYYIEIAGY